MSEKKMKPEVKAKWLEALRSGEFEQGEGALCREGKFCCLGVLSELAYREGVTDKWTSENGTGSTYYGKRRGSQSTGFTPKSVMRWAGLEDDDPMVVLEKDYKADLASLNDNGSTFAQIADLIEEHL